jgi:hypothetical protein
MIKEKSKTWYDSVLNHVPHGEEGSLQLEWNDAMTLLRILLTRGYAVCVTKGYFDEDVKLAWIYAGDTDNLQFSNYDNVVFTSLDYIEDYPEAYYQTIEDEKENEIN